MPVAVAGTMMAAAIVAMPVEATRVGNLAVASLTALIQQRSPGLRSRGDLVDIKARRDRAKARSGFAPDIVENPFVAKVTPVESASPGNLIGSGILSPLQNVLLPDVFNGGSAALLDGFTGAGGGFLPGIVVGGGGGGSGIGSSGGGGSGGGGGGGSSGGDPVVTPPAPVPEPATWVTFIVGFGVTGWLLRAARWMPRLHMQKS